MPENPITEAVTNFQNTALRADVPPTLSQVIDGWDKFAWFQNVLGSDEHHSRHVSDNLKAKTKPDASTSALACAVLQLATKGLRKDNSGKLLVGLNTQELEIVLNFVKEMEEVTFR